MAHANGLRPGVGLVLVGILAFDGVSALDLTGPLETLSAARLPRQDKAQTRCYKLMVVGLTSRDFVTESGLHLKANVTIDSVGPLDTIIIPGGQALRNSDTRFRAGKWLASRSSQTRRMASVATGIYALAQSGLLDGRRVTTHWRFASHVAQSFPKIEMSQDALFVRDERFYSSGGGTAGIEMTLALIKEDYGAVIAQKVAQELVMRVRPPGEKSESLAHASYQSDPSERIADLPGWIQANLHETLTVENLAERAGMSLRHFRRVFGEVFKCAPSDFVEELRLSEARRRLLSMKATVESVAESVGFKSPDVFRRAFERRVGLTPTAFRRAKGMRSAQYDYLEAPLPRSPEGTCA